MLVKSGMIMSVENVDAVMECLESNGMGIFEILAMCCTVLLREARETGVDRVSLQEVLYGEGQMFTVSIKSKPQQGGAL